MAKVFVSYSRKNIDFCKRLTDELTNHDIGFWVDWEGIPPTVDWMKEIEKGIREAEAFLAIVTPEWISSEVCQRELNIATKNGKRLIPVVPCDIAWNSVPSTLAQLNFIFFTETFDFNKQFEMLVAALNTDYEWLRTQTRLQGRAHEWDASEKDDSFLLRGKDLEVAEQAISVNANKNPNPTSLQREYVLKSRQSATRQKRVTTGVMTFIIVMLAGITAYLGIPRLFDKIAQSKARGEMVPIPAGPSIFGTEDLIMVNDFGFPKRQTIELLPAFQIDKYEVNNYQYGLCVKYGNCTVPVVPVDFDDKGLRKLPVVNVTLFQANTYCQWLGRRLPNQFEWERAARGPQLYDWPWGNDREPTPKTANMPWGEYTPSGLLPVGSNPDGKSPEGIFNLVGNAAEWTSSLVEEHMTYDSAKAWDSNPATYNGTLSYAGRGGSWKVYVDELALFNAELGLSAHNDLGFRCAKDAEIP